MPQNHIKMLSNLFEAFNELAQATFEQIQVMDERRDISAKATNDRTKTMSHLRVYAGVAVEIMNMQAQNKKILVLTGPDTHETITAQLLKLGDDPNAIYGRDLDADLAKLGLHF